MKLNLTKEQCMRMAEREGHSEVGAGPLARDPLALRAALAVHALRTPDASMATVANTVRQSIADVIEGLLTEVEKEHAARVAADNALQHISLMLGGTDEWADQETMISNVTQLVAELVPAPAPEPQ